MRSRSRRNSRRECSLRVPCPSPSNVPVFPRGVLVLCPPQPCGVQCRPRRLPNSTIRSSCRVVDATRSVPLAPVPRSHRLYARSVSCTCDTCKHWLLLPSRSGTHNVFVFVQTPDLDVKSVTVWSLFLSAALLPDAPAPQHPLCATAVPICYNI